MKKAQGISMNVIIIAAIALLVLVVLSIIFLGRTSDFGKQTADCENKGGRCLAECEDANVNPEGYTQPYTIWNCPAESGTQCCIRLS